MGKENGGHIAEIWTYGIRTSMPGYELGLINEEAGSISTNGYELMSRELISRKTAAKRK
ncbi:hypothetical protein ACSAZK_00200 [Methanosarcina sp. Mfa9]|uniref:hypothetical protein n=1 Tax=Methanosarcina sp. Mfa9 TaxID=3439063 RepID=UPI003F8550E9